MSRIAKAAVVALGTGAVVIGGAGLAMANAGAEGGTYASPGVASGNTVQVPLDVPINLCGNTVDVIAALNPAFGNACVNVDRPGAGHDDGGKSDDGYGKSHDGYGKSGYGYGN